MSVKGIRTLFGVHNELPDDLALVGHVEVRHCGGNASIISTGHPDGEYFFYEWEYLIQYPGNE